MTVTHEDLTLDWLGYATLRIETSDGFVAYLDPGRYGVLTGEWTPDTDGISHPEGTDYDARDGNLVCVTHDHHYDSDGIQRVAREDATVVVYEGVDAENIDRDVLAVADLPYSVRRIETDEQVDVTDNVRVRALPAYNDPDGPNTSPDGTPFHPEGFGCGYLLSFSDDESSVLWPGDSDALDEHTSHDPTVFAPPIGRSFTMDRHAAADLAEQLNPGLVLPIHYNTFAALEADSKAFAEDVEQQGISVVLDET
jgi:L-ascorbate metabolism protein UlaG (beta-lactamase superfamily)